jgi:hypothetical protein
MTPSIAWLNVTNNDTSLAIISASTRGGADLLIAALICEQTSQNFFSNRTFCGVQCAVIAAL